MGGQKAGQPSIGLTSLGIIFWGIKGMGKMRTIAKKVRQAGKGVKALSIYTGPGTILYPNVHKSCMT